MIEVSNLTVRFGSKTAVDNLSVSINKGESILLAGANGSGKTTLIRSMAGVLNTSAGKIYMDDLESGPVSRGKIAYIPASLSFYDGLKIKEAIKLHRSFYRGFTFKEIGGYSFDSNQKVSALSRGEKTLFFLTLALSCSPEYILIDDVIHFLDPHLRDIFLQTILKLIGEQELALVIAAQSSFEIEGILDRVIIMDKGKIFLDEPVEDLKCRFVKIYAEEFHQDLPVVFSRDWQGVKELFLYPFEPDLYPSGKVEYLNLPDILRAFIGGEYDSH